MNDLAWPARPTCHDGDPLAERFPGSAEWRPEDPQGEHVKEAGPYGSPYGYPFKTCGFCGSMSAEDLYRYMTDGITPVSLEMADWKYGYPHKFYVKGIANPKAGQQVGGISHVFTDDAGVQQVEYESRPGSPTTFAKFYTRHLLDLEDATLEAVADGIALGTGVLFHRDAEGRLHWSTGQ